MDDLVVFGSCIFVVFVCAFGIGYTKGYKDGQIDAISGKIKFEKVEAEEYRMIK